MQEQEQVKQIEAEIKELTRQRAFYAASGNFRMAQFLTDDIHALQAERAAIMEVGEV